MEDFYSVGTFAKMARISRDALHFYDSIGLLSPAGRGDNNYRYYSIRQLSTLNMIRLLQELGMSLEEIKTFKDKRNTDNVCRLLDDRLKDVDDKIDRWIRARKLLLNMQKTIRAVSDAKEGDTAIRFLPAESIALGNLNDYSQGKNDYIALVEFYRNMMRSYPSLDLNHPVWGLFSRESIEKGNWEYPDRYYLYNPEGHDQRPSGYYAIGFTRGGYGGAGAIFDKLLSYIRTQGYEISGNTYVEYPLNEFSEADEANYLIRVMISVQKKSGNHPHNSA